MTAPRPTRSANERRESSSAIHAEAATSGMGQRILLGAAALIAGLLASGIFSMTVYNRAHNEQMYVAAAYLLTQDKQLYRDFAFLQMPYSPLVYALVYALSGGGMYLLKAKLVNFLWMALGAGLLFARAHRAGRDVLLATTLLIFYFANYYLLRAAIEASNYAMPIALGLLAYALWLRGVEGRMRYAPACALAGLALAGAAGAKLYYASLALPFGIMLLFYPRRLRFVQRLQQGLLPVTVGGLAGLLPVGMYALRDWDTFVFNNLGYHLTNTEWRLQSGFQDTLGLKLDAARDLLANPNYLTLELWIAAALLMVWAAGRLRRTLAAPGVVLGGLVSVTALFTAFNPSPLFPQYFAMPVPFLLVWMAEIYGQARADVTARKVLAGLALVCALAAILPVWPRHVNTYKTFFDPATQWTGIAYAQESRQIRRAIEESGAAADSTSPSTSSSTSPRLATLSPIMALETHMAFYPELATGSFLLRVGDLLSAAERARYVASSPSTLGTLLDENPPAAILIGEEGAAETPLREYAEAHGYRRVDLELESGELWLR